MLASKQFQSYRDVTGFQSLVALVENMMTEHSNNRNWSEQAALSPS
jgi:hypothetical protein